MNGTPPPSDEPIMPQPGEESTIPQGGSTPVSAAMQIAVQARDDLALKLGIPADQITISSAQAVTWSDSSLGCPQPGMNYTQVLTPGYLILLEAGGKIYEYHASKGTSIIYCENPTPPVPGMPGDI